MTGSDRILIVDQEGASRAAISDLLRAAGYETSEMASGEEALEAARRERPRLVILEVSLPGICGYEVCHALREELGENLPIVFISRARTESFDRVAGLLLGADDYLVQPVAPGELLARVRRLLRRTSAVPSGVASRLTQRQQDVLRLLADGLGQEEIAKRLFISPRTVGTHIEHIFSKLGVRSRAQAVALAYRDHLAGSNPRQHE